MSDVLEKKTDEALREYLEAVDKYNKLIDRYIPLRPVVPGEEIVLGERITKAALKELDEAEAKVTEARKKWERLINL